MNQYPLLRLFRFNPEDIPYLDLMDFLSFLIGQYPISLLFSVKAKKDFQVLCKFLLQTHIFIDKIQDSKLIADYIPHLMAIPCYIDQLPLVSIQVPDIPAKMQAVLFPTKADIQNLQTVIIMIQGLQIIHGFLICGKNRDFP